MTQQYTSDERAGRRAQRRELRVKIREAEDSIHAQRVLIHHNKSLSPGASGDRAMARIEELRAEVAALEAQVEALAYSPTQRMKAGGGS